MKLNQNTTDILTNFAGINTNILIKQGDELSTISTMRNIFAKAKISDQFTNEFGIYDLNQFLSTVSGFAKPELSLQDKYMTISSEGSKSKATYFYSDPSVIVSPTKEVNMPEKTILSTVYVDSRDRDATSYPNSNDYTVELKTATNSEGKLSYDSDQYCSWVERTGTCGCTDDEGCEESNCNNILIKSDCNVNTSCSWKAII